MRVFQILMIYFSSISMVFAQNSDQAEAKLAFDYLNKIRANPGQFSKEIGADLKSIKASKALKWNDTLAIAAQQKVNDMSEKNYFAHVDPKGYAMNYYINKAGYKLEKRILENKTENNFESISSGPASGVEAIKDLILDDGVANLGHRKHLLAIGDWNAALKDIGIGFLKVPSVKGDVTYICILIAKH